MEPNEQHKQRTTLEDEFTSIIDAVGMEGGVVAEKVTDARQYKYRIDSASAYKDRLEALGAVMTPGSPIEQTDSYFLYPGEQPGLNTDTLCLREEKGFVDYAQDVPQEAVEICKLIVKTSPDSNDPNASRLVRYATIKDGDAQIGVLRKINEIRQGKDLAPYRASKKRSTYLLPTNSGESIVVDIDEQVMLSDASTDFVPYPMGDFLKIKVPKNAPHLIDELREQLGLTGDAFDVPYIAKEAFLERLYTSGPNSIALDPDNPEHLWTNSTHAPYYYDARANKFVRDIDPLKLKGFDAHERNQIKEQIEQICADLDRADGGQDLLSRSSGGGSGSSTYEKLSGHDGFAKYPTIRASLESATLWRKRWQPSDRRIIFSRVVFGGDSGVAGIFIHYAGSHQGYDQWLRQH